MIRRPEQPFRRRPRRDARLVTKDDRLLRRKVAVVRVELLAIRAAFEDGTDVFGAGEEGGVRDGVGGEERGAAAGTRGSGRGKGEGG